jgi:hypothetical protein
MRRWWGLARVRTKDFLFVLGGVQNGHFTVSA